MNKRALFLVGSLLFFVTASFLQAQGVALSAKVGSTGIGGDITVGLSRAVNLRAGVQGFGRSETRTQEDIEYDADVTLLTGLLVFDLHPGGKGFRLSAGGYYNGNEVSAVSSDDATYTINGRVYRASDIGRIEGDVDFDEVAPYLGIGWGNAVAPGSRMRFAFDLGAFYQGTPNVQLRATPVNPALVPPGFAADLEAERQTIQDDLEDYKIYPVLTLGVSYRF